MLLSDLLAFCKAQARIEARSYVDPYARGQLFDDQLSAWRSDKRKRDAARKACFAAFPARLRFADEKLVPGSYGHQKRLFIAQDGSLDYTPVLYAPREIYEALLSYLEATN
jgi:hypothetical protein